MDEDAVERLARELSELRGRVDELKLEIDNLRSEIKRMEGQVMVVLKTVRQSPPRKQTTVDKPLPPPPPPTVSPIDYYWQIPKPLREEYADTYFPKYVWELPPEVRMQLMLYPHLRIEPLTYLFKPSRIMAGIIGVKTIEEIDEILKSVRRESLSYHLKRLLHEGVLTKTDFKAWRLKKIYDRLRLGERRS
jgi:DNA-binding transcriptional ArsR family regulator